MNKFTEKEWIEDFQEFVRSEGTAVPKEASEKLFAMVRKDLNPSSWFIFAKLLAIHSVVGTLSLAICNQFDINPFRTGFSLSNYFMKFGHSTCMFLCGVLFVGLSLLMTRAIVRPEELRVLRKNALLEIFGLSMISLGVFAAVGAEFTFAVAVLWLVGAMLGGTAVVMVPRRRVLAA